MKKLLDVGCGPGTLTNLSYYDKKKDKYKIYGIDIEEKNIKQIKTTFPSGIFLTADAEKIPHPDNYFDEIAIRHVLEHVKNPSKVLEEVKRVVREKGTIIVAVPHDKLEKLMAKIVQNYMGNSDSHHQRIFNGKTLRATIRKAGLIYQNSRQKKWPLFFITLFLALISKIFRLTHMELQSGVFLAKNRNYLKNNNLRKVGLLFYKMIELVDKIPIFNRLFPWEIEAYVSKK